MLGSLCTQYLKVFIRPICFLEYRFSIVRDTPLSNNLSFLHYFRAILCDNGRIAQFFPLKTGLSDQLLVLCWPDGAERKVHNEAAGK